MKKGLLIGFIIVVLAAVGGFYLLHRKIVPAANLQPSYTPVDEKVALAQLESDMQNATPHFIVPTWQQGQTLTPEEQKIAMDVAVLMSAQSHEQYPNNPVVTPENILQFDIYLDAIGKRYILITNSGADKTSDTILDSQTGQITSASGIIPVYLPNSDIALGIDSQAIYAYSLDEASSTPVVGSQLSGSETYNDGIGELGPPINVQETHTKDSITIDIFDSSKVIPNPDGGTMYTKIRQKTYSF